MERLNFKTLLLAVSFSAFLFSSCSDDNEIQNPVSLGAEVTVTNTLQKSGDASVGGTGDAEVAIETFFGLPINALAATASVSESKEFPSFLMGLYDIDINENSVKFTLVAPINDPVYSPYFRTIEAGTIDRYYFNFKTAQNITGFSSSNAAVNLKIISATEFVVEIGQGYDFKTGTTFTITLKN